MSAQQFKDPDATLDFTVDWVQWLGSDTIVSASWDVPDALSVEASPNTTTTATVWVSGGTHGADYTLTNRITTAAGRVDDRSLTLHVRNR